jgi:predicted permease
MVMRLDLRYALRTMVRNPGYAVTAIVCLALAMGVNATLFGLLDSMYFRKLPVAQADRIVQIHREHSQACSFHDYLAFRDKLQSLRVAAWLPAASYADIAGDNLEIRFEMVSADYARVLGLNAFRGRWFVPEEDSPSAAPVMVLTHRFWQTKLHGDPAAVGAMIRIQEGTFRIVGIAPPEYEGALPPWTTDAWVPNAAISAAAGMTTAEMMVNLVGRLNPGATLERATAEMRGLNLPARVANDPLHVEAATGFVATGRQYLRPVLTLMVVVCAVVLLIACVNVANLLLARAASRHKEMMIRRALGARSTQLFRASLMEGLILAACSVVLGMAAGYLTGRLLEAALPSVPTQYYNGIRLAMDWRVLALLGAVGAASAIAFSLPAVWERSRAHYSDIYPLVQVALSLALLVATGLLLRSLHRVQVADPGFATANRLAVNLLMPPNKFTPVEATLLQNSLLSRTRALPGVKNATLVFGAATNCASGSALAPARRIRGAAVEPNYFDVLRVPVVRGAVFEADRVVVNETMARQFWPGEDAIGKTVWLGCKAAGRSMATVGGIVRDRNDRVLDEQPSPALYLSRRDSPSASFGRLIVWTAGDPSQWARPLLEVARSGSLNLSVFGVQSLEEEASRSLWELKWEASLLGAVGVLALALAAIGLYGVVAWSVSRRTREIGIRMALGAKPADVHRLVLGHGLRITIFGIAAGLVLSAGTVRLLRGFLYGMSPFDPLAFAAASAAWLAIALMASWLPARRAMRVDPGVALKME